MENCTTCGGEHEKGSPEWRDCQQTSLEQFVADTEKWQFEVTGSQQERVREAHVRFTAEFGGIPDVSAIRMLISHQFTNPTRGNEGGPTINVRELKKFWDSFVEDIPVVVRQTGMLPHVEAMWGDKKVAYVLRNLGLKYMDWDTVDTTCSVKSILSLRQTADFMEKAENNGYALYHFDVEDDTVMYYFRKGKVVG